MVKDLLECTKTFLFEIIVFVQKKIKMTFFGEKQNKIQTTLKNKNKRSYNHKQKFIFLQISLFSLLLLILVTNLSLKRGSIHI